MENTNNKIIKEKDETDNYWQTQAILVMNNLNLSDKNKYLFPVKYSINGTKINNYKINNLELPQKYIDLFAKHLDVREVP